jgi:hypothetical protein
MPDSSRRVMEANGWIALLAVVFAGACSEPTRPSAAEDIPPAARMEAITSTSLTGTVDSEVAEAPAVRITDKAGRPVAGVRVTFLPLPGAAYRSGNQPLRTVVTNTEGVASSGGWRLGRIAGVVQTFRAFAGNLMVEFNATAAAGPVASLRAISGEGQVGVAGQELRAPLVVKARDEFNNAVPGAEVRFSVVTGGGEVRADPVITDSVGVASSGLWILGAAAGVQVATATSGGVETHFAVEACISVKCRQLLFVRDGDIHVVDLFTGETRQLTRDGISDSPSWSPDGSRIAFVRRGALHVMNADGTNEILVVENRVGYGSVSWSPAGNAIAFDRCGTGCGVYVVDVLDGTTEPRMVVAEGRLPAWSPDGAQIAFINAAGSLELVTPDGSVRTEIPGIPALELSALAWSPDGRAIAFSAVPSPHGAYDDIYVLEGSVLTRITNERSMVHPTSFEQPTWSESGARVAFSVRQFVFDDDMGFNGAWERSIQVIDLACFRGATNRSACDGPQTLVSPGHSPAWK